MVTTIIVGVVAFVVGAVAGILFTNNNVKKVQATLDYFESALDDLQEEAERLFRKTEDQERELTTLKTASVTKTTKAKKAAS